MPVRAPHLFKALRCFCLGAFRALLAELEEGAELPFAFEEHASYGRPALYEYKPLVRGFVESRADRLARREDARAALQDLARAVHVRFTPAARQDGGAVRRLRLGRRGVRPRVSRARGVAVRPWPFVRR